MKASIVIPIYREPTPDELVSLHQCCTVLSRYPMIIVTPEGFSLATYESLWQSYGLTFSIEYFDSVFFQNIAGYNRLMLSEEFYLRFEQYDYILIYQPDAYVFEDQLDRWCQKGYDYIGAPLVGKHTDNIFLPSLPLRVGNGGFSLRRVQTYLNYFNGKQHVFTPKQLINKIAVWQKPYTRIFIWLLMLMGWRNTPKSVAAHWQYNEDDFWSGILDNSNYALSKPSPLEALSFAFERFPTELYEITKQIPFGCHAWKKYQFEEFWKQYIDLSNKK